MINFRNFIPKFNKIILKIKIFDKYIRKIKIFLSCPQIWAYLPLFYHLIKLMHTILWKTIRISTNIHSYIICSTKSSLLVRYRFVVTKFSFSKWSLLLSHQIVFNKNLPIDIIKKDCNRGWGGEIIRSKPTVWIDLYNKNYKYD